ncbi:MAG TPA: HEAT repeat domain-containing protein, partial [Pyrinomonadaceae bacterium]
MNTGNSLFKKINESLFKSSAMFLIVAGFGIALLPETKFAAESDSFVFAPKNNVRDEDFDKKFRAGRDLIDKEEWARAAEKFKEIVAEYPGNKSTDAALYWLAFCYKKQKLFKETGAALERLLKDFPASSWADDARVMQMEIAVPLGRMIVSNNGISTTAPPGIYTRVPNSRVKPASTVTMNALENFESFKTTGETNTSPPTPLDREDEIKIAAFQSLLAADAKKGIEAMSGILKRDSKASETLKLEVLRAVRRPRLLNNNYFTHTGTALTLNPVQKELIPLLRESLVKGFQNESTVKIRKEIIYTLTSLNDEQTVNYLFELYASEIDREVKKAILNGFGSSWGINGFSVAAIPGNGSLQNQKGIVAGSPAQKIEFAKLLEIVRTEKDAELRSLSLSNLQRFGGWDTNGQIVEVLSKIYDSETNEDLKKSIVQSLGKIKQSTAAGKLLDIARNDKSDKLRLAAV